MAVGCSLVELPVEVRINIYQHLFNLQRWYKPLKKNNIYSLGSCHLLYRHDTVVFKRLWRKKALKGFASILRTCRLIREEAVDELYACTIFYLRVPMEVMPYNEYSLSPSEMRQFLSRVQHITIEVGINYEIPPRFPQLTHKLLDLLPDHVPGMTQVMLVSTNDDLWRVRQTGNWKRWIDQTSTLVKRCSVRVFLPEPDAVRKDCLDRILAALDG